VRHVNNSFTFLVVFLAFGSEPLQAQEEPVPARTAYGGVVTAATLPPDYTVTTIPLRQGKELLGTNLVVRKGRDASKVLIMVQHMDLQTDALKRAAMKAFVNGIIDLLSSTNMKLVETKFPDAATVDLKTRIRPKLKYVTADKKNVYVEFQIFFAQDGYAVAVIADNNEDLKTLSQWAETVGPAPPEGQTASRKTAGRPQPQAQHAKKNYEGLILAAPLPAGFQMTNHPMRNGARLLGNTLAVTSKNTSSRAAVTVENRDLPTDDHKRTAYKAYVNGTAQALAKTGATLAHQEIPNPATIDVTKRTPVKLTYKTPDGRDLYIDMRIFFTRNGYNVAVCADNKEDLKTLTQWASTITPLTKVPTQISERPRKLSR